ncbi:uncharacterized protein LOC143273156 [Peromyscus maniculatus bairdii]|uniref:uncharacterized protein LOC143273156 n=1 Tax=Peromyscus maniculatus bairdii TaxID=230844 RepID=UPI003FD39D3E
MSSDLHTHTTSIRKKPATTRIMGINVVSGSRSDHGHQHGFQWDITWFRVAAWITDINMVSSSSMDHCSLLRLNPENEPFFIPDSLLVLKVRVMVWLGRVSGGQDLPVLAGCPASIPGVTIAFAANEWPRALQAQRCEYQGLAAAAAAAAAASCCGPGLLAKQLHCPSRAGVNRARWPEPPGGSETCHTGSFASSGSSPISGL